MKNTLTTLFNATVVLMVSFGAFPNAWGQTASTGQTQIVKIRTLQIDAAARPGVGQFVPADDDVQQLRIPPESDHPFR